jgi:hypothetical protein
VQTSAGFVGILASRNPGWRFPELIRVNPFRLILLYDGYAADRFQSRKSTRQVQAKRELSMIASHMGAVPAEFPQERDGVADGGAQGPMSQQDVAGSHGYEMHPQKFVRLVGCHDLNAAKHEAANRLH